MAGALEGFTRSTFSAEAKTRDVYSIGSGPAVIVIAEIPGITPKVAEFARKVADIGCTAVLPSLFGEPGAEPSFGRIVKTLGPICVSREFTLFALKKTSPVTTWLRALAAYEHERCGGPGVGAVGMCLTGGFALAMMVDEVVLAPVLSQPSLPFSMGRRRRADVGVSDEDLAQVKRRVKEGTCVLGLRFTGDPVCRPERFETLREELGDGFVAVELDSSAENPFGHPKNAHSVLTEHLQDRPGTPTREALDAVLDLFRSRLVSPAA